MRRARGFTLIELLVAMAIVVVIGVIALGGLNTVINQQAIAEEQAERWREVQLAMRMVVQDLYQVHPRVTRDEGGARPLASFLADPEHVFALEFSRGGWTNPTDQPRGAVLRVAYDIEDTTLVRFYWPVADRTLLTPFGRNDILTGVESMVVTYFDDQLEPINDWPPLDPSGTSLAGLVERPRAIEIEFTLTDLGRVWRLIELKS